jgi:hypothetical protein
MMDIFETLITNLAGDRAHYEKVNHEMTVPQKLELHLLAARGRLWPIYLLMKVVFKRSNHI